MKFDIHILGSGSAAPTLSRRPSSQAINIQENWMLIDCGEGTQVQLRKFKIKFQKINQIFISHLHGDHVFGLIGLINTYQLLGRTQSLNLYGPKGLEEFITVQLQLTESYLKYPLHFHVVDTNKHEKICENNVCEVFSIPLKHRIACSGYLIKEKSKRPHINPEKMAKHHVAMAYANKIRAGETVENRNGKMIEASLLTDAPEPPRSYAYCSDTKFSEEVIHYVEKVDLLYHEATFLNEMNERANQTYHSTALQAGAVANKANVKQLLIGHFSARYKTCDALVDEAKTLFNNVIAASDGMVVEIK